MIKVVLIGVALISSAFLFAGCGGAQEPFTGECAYRLGPHAHVDISLYAAGSYTSANSSNATEKLGDICKVVRLYLKST